jgi:peptide/nickel transport system substrate-binding protein
VPAREGSARQRETAIRTMRVLLRLPFCLALVFRPHSGAPLRTLLLPLLALLAVLLPGAVPLAAAEPPPLVVMIDSDPATLDPLLATDAYGVRIAHQLIFETFVVLGDDLSLQPGLARWERLSPTRYRFTLAAGRRFHSGAPLTAADAVYTLQRFMAPEVGSPYGAALREEIAAVQQTGALRFEVELKAPYAGFLSHLILPVVSREPGGVPTPWGDLNGSGPFRFERREVGEIDLLRNPDYPRPAGAARVEIKVVRDESTRLLKLEKGDIDLVVNVLPLDKIAQFQRGPLRKDYTVQEAPGLSFQYLGFNLKDPVLADVRVRRAIAHAIHVELLVERRQLGHSQRATGLMPPGSPFADASLEPYAYDPAAARRLLDEAGYPVRDGKRFALSYKTTTDRSAVIQARVIQNDLRQVGIDVDVRSYEWATFYGDIKAGNFQLYSLRWIGVSDPDFLYELLDSKQLPPDGRNRDRYANPRVDALLEQARVAPDPQRRGALYRQVDRIVYDELPYLPLWHNHNVAIVSRRWSGFRLHPSGGFEHLAEMRPAH